MSFTFLKFLHTQMLLIEERIFNIFIHFVFSESQFLKLKSYIADLIACSYWKVFDFVTANIELLLH